MCQLDRRRDIQHNDAQHNDIQHHDNQLYDTMHNNTQHKNIQHNDTQHNDTTLWNSAFSIMTLSKWVTMLTIVMLIIAFSTTINKMVPMLGVIFAECRLRWVSQIGLWCWVWLFWMSLYWMTWHHPTYCFLSNWVKILKSLKNAWVSF
jgi:hypothetical protein